LDTFWRRRSTVAFLVVAFGPSWIGWSIYHTLELDRRSALGETLFLFGWSCSVAGFVAWYVEGGWPAVKDLARRCVRAAVAPRWWLLALAFPMVYQAVAFAVHGLLTGSAVGEARPAAIADYWSTAGLALLLTGPLGEEAGWRGFLLPRLLERHTPLGASLLLGLIWAVWHVPIFLHAEFSTLHGTLIFTGTIVCYTLVMTVLFLHTRQSVLLAIVIHWTFNVSYYLAAPKLFPGVDVRGLAFNYTRLTVFALAAAALVIATGARSFTTARLRPAAIPLERAPQ
jgi:membrane protease YdiL (CAAX protease family)